MKKNQAQVNLQKTTLFVFKSKKNDSRPITDPTVPPSTTVTLGFAGAKH